MRKRIIVSIILFLVLSCCSAYAGDPTGWWLSTSGSKIYITANMKTLTVSITGAKSSRASKYSGWWTKLGNDFSYNVPGSTGRGIRQCCFAPGNDDMIYVKNPQGQTIYMDQIFSKFFEKHKCRRRSYWLVDVKLRK